jgi:hypothetical protein
VDDRGSGWSGRPGDEERLAQIEVDLATLQDDITRVMRTVAGQVASGQRTGPFGRPTWRVEPSASSGRGGPTGRFPSDAIGGVEGQLSTLRSEVNRLLSMVGVPRRATAGGPPPTWTRTSESPGRSRSDTSPEEPAEVMPTGDQADSEASDDPISRALEPSEGPGGSGPWHEKKPETVEPKDFGF